MPTQDEVRLHVPATPEYLRLARVTATGLASRLGFTFDEVEDLRLAIDELCFTLIGSKGRTGTVGLSYELRPDGLEIVGTGHFVDGPASLTLSELSQQILSALVDDFAVSQDDDGRPCFRLRKHRHPVA